MRKKMAYSLKDDYQLLEVNESFFKGYVCLLKFHNVSKPVIVQGNNRCFTIKDNEYEWLEVYPRNGKYAITILYDDKGKLIEWYFDISKKVGMEKGIPYEDDLYLDLVITPSGKKVILDEDELLDAKEQGIITQKDVDLAYQTLKELEDKYVDHFDDLVHLTDYLLGLFKLKDIKLVPYNDEDYTFVYDLKKQSYIKYIEKYYGMWDEEKQQEYFQRFIQQYRKGIYTIEYDDVKIGFFNDSIEESYEIGNICILPKYQNKGIGTKILKQIIKAHQFCDIKIQCFKDNPVKALYTKLGFIDNGETEYHYQMIIPKGE